MMNVCVPNMLILIYICLTLTQVISGRGNTELSCAGIEVRTLPCDDEPNCHNGTLAVNCICLDGFYGDRCQIFRGNYVLHWSFDTLDGLILWELNNQTNYSAEVEGKINGAVSTDRTTAQWIDIGIHIACMTDPATCGTSGGAISLWWKVIACPSLGAVVSTLQNLQSGGSAIYCGSQSMTYLVSMSSGHFSVRTGRANNVWVHSVLNFLGPNNQEGISIYKNGQHVGNHTTITQSSTNAPDGKIVVGRVLTGVSNYYASVQVDELLFFNQTLTEVEIRLLSQ